MENSATLMPSKVRGFLGRIDLMTFMPMLALICVGELFIYGTGQQVGGFAASTFWKKQLLWIGIGFAFWAVLAMMDYKMIRFWVWIAYFGSLVLLVLVLKYGITVYGAKRWLDIAGFRIQPSEFGKLGLLLTVSWLLSLKGFDVNKFRYLILVAVVTIVPFLLILKEPDLGSSLVIIPFVAVLLFVAKLKWKLVMIFIFMGVMALPLAYPFLNHYQKERILVFLDPDRDPRNRGWNQLQAELAVGSGGMYGKGYMKGTQNTLGFLPKTVSNTDFVFSVIAEETGFAGTAGLIVLYSFMVLGALRTALLARDDFGRYLACGIATIIFFHSVVNIGMSIRLMPVTGIPLPFVSYGGSFMFTNMIYFGILQSIYAHRNPFLLRNQQ